MQKMILKHRDNKKNFRPILKTENQRTND